MQSNIFVLGPVFAPLIGAVLTLVFRKNNTVQRYIALVAGIVAWLCGLAALATNIQTATPQIYVMGGWRPPFGIVLVADMLSALFVVMATTVETGGLLYAVGCKDKSVTYPSFMALFLSMGAGLSGALYTGDFFTLFVFLELMVISSVCLVAISDNSLGLEAAIKYLLISAMGTLFLLLGIASLYATFGTLNMAQIGQLLATEQRPLLAQASAAMLMSAFLLKSAVFPFHFWQPDFHTTAPTPVHAVLSSVVVKVGVYGIIRMTTLMFTVEADAIKSVVLVLGINGIFFGSLGALRTYDAKRMLAYSTFGQIGFILVAIGWGDPLTQPLALAAAIIYAVNHSFVKSSLLMLTGVVSSRTKTKTARLSEIGGVGHNMRLTGALYMLGGLALAGIPPLNGFISKLAIVQGGIDAQGWLALGLAVGGGIITLIYMMRTWQLVFQKKPDGKPDLKPYGDSTLAPLLLIGLCVILGLFAGPLVDVSTAAVSQLAEPEIYIAAVLGG
ncbi:MAG: complex I subunit 5 family protein [Anaerolineae bacterium]